MPNILLKTFNNNLFFQSLHVILELQINFKDLVFHLPNSIIHQVTNHLKANLYFLTHSLYLSIKNPTQNIEIPRMHKHRHTSGNIYIQILHVEYSALLLSLFLKKTERFF
jgi:hypothetical protein